ncbi:NADH dehydrogenase [ubiquinone] iron-sulfur protein 5 [Eublepharis macularius]|uniref:NADH dehydrogenase [ubiquinone] iron-sulfur protein 5 n=1 Tax=Eublepharis macularius TaxID=481883 RepID=A0AA97KFX8_EUBMA|nr:NADH dehydrogenase [ubiquinone] iron-sulfur protein 5 [Eublepharis macularius]XP_054854715.1 NADH dehydrogenase [ubiquinone] iron-sulfur protein 5 [Eublepharis macularius]XP_054854716.1 NADH dehydrogenase [ubiquinone] iron-sulfur protein 5 [Eublepharis macularius]
MPVLDLQDKLGIDIDRWFSIQTTKQPNQRASLCHAFEKEWLECADGIGYTRAKTECKLEKDDLTECLSRVKMMQRMRAILDQRKKLIKEGKYTPPDYHTGKLDADP